VRISKQAFQLLEELVSSKSEVVWLRSQEIRSKARNTITLSNSDKAFSYSAFQELRDAIPPLVQSVSDNAYEVTIDGKQFLHANEEEEHLISMLVNDLDSGGYEDEFHAGGSHHEGYFRLISGPGFTQKTIPVDWTQIDLHRLSSLGFLSLAAKTNYTSCWLTPKTEDFQGTSVTNSEWNRAISSAPASGIEVFVSHSQKDNEIAEAFTNLLKLALNLQPEGIRCTSVEGHKLPLGARTDEQLPQEILGTRVFVGIVTSISIESAYVLFELGARWGPTNHYSLYLLEVQIRTFSGALSQITTHFLATLTLMSSKL